MTEFPYSSLPDPITDFEYRNWLVLGRAPYSLKLVAREAMYVVMEDYTVNVEIGGKLHCITVPAGMTTDLASVPKIFTNIIGRVGPHLEACIVHDWLYVAWQLQDREPTKADHDFANRVLYAGLKAANCHWVTRWGVWIAMELPWLSWNVFKGRDKDLFVDIAKFVAFNEEDE